MSLANSNSNTLGRLWVERLVRGSSIGFGITVGGGDVVLVVDVVLTTVVGCVVGATVLVVVAAPVINHVHIICNTCTVYSFKN